MPRAADNTRLALIRAAEELFAQRGFESVSLREVSHTAGQANNSSVSYHFGSREGLIDAILERHSAPIQAHYVAQVDVLQRRGAVALRDALEILALPIIAKLDDPDGGWAYLSLAAQLSVSPSFPLVERRVASTPEVLRLTSLIWPHCRAPAALVPFRMERLAALLYSSIVSWRRNHLLGFSTAPRAAFESDLIDSMVQLIEQPISEQTAAALDVRPIVD